MDLTVRDQSSNLEQFLVLLYILDPTIWNCFRLLCPSPVMLLFVCFCQLDIILKPVCCKKQQKIVPDQQLVEE